MVFGGNLVFLMLIYFRTVIAEEISSPPVSDFGEWHAYEYCPEGTFAKGFQLKHQPAQTALLDDTALNSIKLICGYNDPGVVNITSGEGIHGQWGQIYSCQLGVINGFQLRVERPALTIDQTATNNVRFFCTGHDDPNFHIEGDGNIWGLWGDVVKCSGQQVIYGMQTQIEPDGGALHDDSALNNVAFLCRDIEPPTTTTAPTTTTPTTTTPTTTTPTTTTPTTTTPTTTTPTTTPTTTTPTTTPTTTTPTTTTPTTTTPTTTTPTTTVPTTTMPTTTNPTTTRVTGTPDPSTSVIIDTKADLSSAWTDRCGGGYHIEEDFTCNGQLVIPPADYNGNQGFWSKCVQESVFECRLIYRSNSTEDWRTLRVTAYFAGTATVEVLITTKTGYHTEFLNGANWETVVADLSVYEELEEIALAVEYSSNIQFSLIDKIVIEH